MVFKKKAGAPAATDRAVPQHIAIIMDGNGRWAQKRGLPRTAGHAAGGETFRTIARYCNSIGVKYFTVYAFSTENWKRPAEEVKAIMSLFNRYLREAIEIMEKEGISLRVFGDLAPIDPELRELVGRVNLISDHVEGMQASLCINYGGRDEIVRAAREFARRCAEGEADPDSLTEENFNSYLYTDGVPDPELIIRPGGEKRTSNFLMWQSAYSEYYFTDVLWPDFTGEVIEEAIADFNRRQRRFGGVV
ncbi:MAG: di-trans,poly-cis-decaprenylcistransferase [Oscillospiraceae bacterium]|nr:di-trans,poly-cis-decaprenylcistransferase [Oscillospiraceae bacterium]